jgi:hypothetical protein
MEKKPLSLEELVAKIQGEREERKNEKLKQEEEASRLFEAQRSDILSRRKTMGGSSIATLLGAFTFTTLIRYGDDDFGTGNDSIDLQLSTTSENLFSFTPYIKTFDIDNSYIQYPTSSLIDGDIEYATFAYNYDNGLIYSLYFNPNTGDIEFRSINLRTGENTFITDLVGSLIPLKDLIYIGGNEFIFIDPFDNTLVTIDIDGNIPGAVTSSFTTYFSNITEYNGKYYVIGSDFDIAETAIAEIDITTGDVSSADFIFFNDSLNLVEPFASIDPIGDPSPDLKVVECVALASTDEIPDYKGERKLFANLMIWNDDTTDDFSSANTWFVIAELNPDTGEATYVGDGSGVHDLFYYKK